MIIKPGSRWRSTVCSTEVVVVRPPSGEAVLECGGVAMAPFGEAPAQPAAAPAPAPGLASGTLAGKRYTDETSAAELLCTKTGAGALTVDGRAVTLKDAKKLPSSD